MAEREVSGGQTHGSVAVERPVNGSSYPAQPVGVVEQPVVHRTTTIPPVRDRVRWGPIIAGLVTTLASMLVLTVLGLAIGLSVFEPSSDGSDVGAATAIWSGASAVIAFLLGGWVTGRTAGVFKSEMAMLNGLLVGLSAIALVLWLTTTGVTNLLGSLGQNIGDIAQVGANQIDPGTAQNAANQAQTQAVEAYDEVRNSAWGTLAGLLLALGASALGGFLGHKSKSRQDGDLADDQY